MSYRSVVLIASLLVAAIFAAVGALSLKQLDDQLDLQFEQEAVRLESVYRAALGELEQQAISLAFGLASDAELRRLTAQGTQARQAGDLQVAEAAHTQLLRKMQSQWIELYRHNDLRQLQVLTTPDLRSLLRMHAPDDQGDSLMELRPLLRAVQADRIPRSGFEIGRAYAGVRGAVPVTHPDAEGNPLHVGTLEVGIGMSDLIDRLSHRLDIGIAVLLRAEAVTDAMWESYRPNSAPSKRNQCCYLLTATGPQAAEWLEAGELKPTAGKQATPLLEWKGRTYHLIRFGFHDYLGSLDSNRPPIGSVVIWKDVTHLLLAHENERWELIRTALSGLAFVLALVLILSKLSRREWRRQLDAQTEALQKLSRHNKLLLETAGDGIYGVDRNGHATFINRSALQMLGYRAEEVVGHDQHQLFHHSHRDGSPYPNALCPVQQTLADGKRRVCEDWFIRDTGEHFPVSMTVAPINEHDHREGAVVVFRDITDYRRRQDELIRLATTDPLTGAGNRRHFLSALESELARLRRNGHPASLLMADLDHFKNVNDRYGHAAGDAVLKHFVAIARNTLRQTDLIGRLGGEEFAMLLPGDDIKGATETAERLRGALENSAAEFCTLRISVTVSIGITELQHADENTDAPLQRADEALYAAKTGGRNRVSTPLPRLDDAAAATPGQR